jgi:prepilin-type N-terminal cleavage/methylation domain-containing protein
MYSLQTTKLIYKSKQRAFTLLEILTALSILVIIMAAVYGSYRAATLSVARCTPRSIMEQQARLFLYGLTSELRCIYAETLYKSKEQISGQNSHKETVRQTKQPVFIARQAKAGRIFLQFVTSALGSVRNYNSGGLSIISYKLNESGKTLLRDVRRYIEGLPNSNQDYVWQPVFENIKTIDLEYFDGQDWRNEWDLESTKILPATVRISLTLENKQTGPLSYMSSAYIMCRSSQIPEVTAAGAVAHNTGLTER